MITHPLLLTMDGVASSVCGFVAAAGALALTGIGDWVESGSIALALAVALPPIGFVCAALGSTWLQQHWPRRVASSDAAVVVSNILRNSPYSRLTVR